MKYSIIFILNILLITSCVNREKEEKYIVKIGNNNVIKLSYIDSLISDNIYYLRLSVIEEEVSNLLIKKYALSKKVPQKYIYDSLKNFVLVTNKEINNYIKNNPNTEPKDVRDYIFFQKFSELKNRLVDSLKKVYNVKINFHKNYFKIVKTDSLFYFKLNESNNKNVVYIISDFNCIACKNSKKIVKKIISKYKNTVSFRFIYYSDYINPTILNTSYFANKEKKFSLLVDILFDNQTIINDKDKLDSLLITNNLCYKQARKELKNFIFLKTFKTKQYLFKNNIYSTPSFIVNNKIIDDKYALDYLESLIIKEFNLKK